MRQCVVSTRDDAKSDALDWISRYVGQVMDLDEVVSLLAEKETAGD